jgi:hypothetical protein
MRSGVCVYGTRVFMPCGGSAPLCCVVARARGNISHFARAPLGLPSLPLLRAHLPAAARTLSRARLRPRAMSLLDERCVKRVTTGATVGAAVGGAVGAPHLLICSRVCAAVPMPLLTWRACVR